jgi:S1-C subfamily serine protease
MKRNALRRITLLALLAAMLPALVAPAAADPAATIEKVKGSVVAVGTFSRTRTPQFQFLGTGFAVEDGMSIITNAHVVPGVLDPAKMEVLAILIPTPGKAGNEQAQWREAKQIALNAAADVAVLRIAPPALPALKVRGSDGVKVGQDVLFTGYPIGPVLGLYPSTHRGMIASISPIAIPQSRAGDLDPRTIKRLSADPFPIFELDATAYPGNSGSPIYDPENGDVLGVINMVFVKGTKESALTQPSGITYAVPSSHIEELLKKSH